MEIFCGKYNCSVILEVIFCKDESYFLYIVYVLNRRRLYYIVFLIERIYGFRNEEIEVRVVLFFIIFNGLL